MCPLTNRLRVRTKQGTMAEYRGGAMAAGDYDDVLLNSLVGACCQRAMAPRRGDFRRRGFCSFLRFLHKILSGLQARGGHEVLRGCETGPCCSWQLHATLCHGAAARAARRAAPRGLCGSHDCCAGG